MVPGNFKCLNLCIQILLQCKFLFQVHYIALAQLCKKSRIKLVLQEEKESI